MAPGTFAVGVLLCLGAPESSNLDKSRVDQSAVVDGATAPFAMGPGGERLALNQTTTTHLARGMDAKLFDVVPEIQLTYVENFLTDDEAVELVRICDSRSGWSPSPLKRQGSRGSGERDDGREGGAERTSSSCPLLWHELYRGATGDESLRREAELTSLLADRVVALFHEIEITPAHVEPFQLVRYRPGEKFAPHGDYHEHPASSSYDGEQRLFTLLVFLNDVSPRDGGGYTRFPHYDLAILPRIGDAVAWANVAADGEPDTRSMHEGVAPRLGDKYVMNVWLTDRPLGARRGTAAR